MHVPRQVPSLGTLVAAGRGWRLLPGRWHGPRRYSAYLQVLGSTNIALNWLSLPPVCTWQSMQTVVRQPAEAGGVVRVGA